jgi:hypothetical protein
VIFCFVLVSVNLLMKLSFEEVAHLSFFFDREFFFSRFLAVPRVLLLLPPLSHVHNVC